MPRRSSTNLSGLMAYDGSKLLLPSSSSVKIEHPARHDVERSPHERLFVSTVGVVGRRSPSNANGHLHLLLA